MRLWQQSMIFLARNQSVKRFMHRRAALSQLSMGFVGGANMNEAAEKAIGLHSAGYFSSLFHLGEYVENEQVVEQTVDSLKSLAASLAESNLDVHISVDPTQIGYLLDADNCVGYTMDLAKQIGRNTSSPNPAARHFLMLDMEDSTLTSFTNRRDIDDNYLQLANGCCPKKRTKRDSIPYSGHTMID